MEKVHQLIYMDYIKVSHRSEEHLGSPSYKILKTIVKMDEEGTQTNGPKDKKTNDYAQGITS